ncbi:double zinc ribbon and ankyrin repeat-containing protein 1 isoform X1 [Fundulus heteroclitus]|uniref:double zinc ribbon and ankyrin repeat-containing protein 1 isoform X1 n=1 Tax=Fundulus heteroclitus TaxID=8078 RepID=UPI00165CCCFA|nr:double zinc ribbon and ankyrin repeat-containing protein 1 isoform X1 [Fundulus heteroclitus]XP_035993603.1 double zinc ribbon and ankyrin repeat-containing protein 1 isoform X1 [Fundulus heteroclitus]
MAAGAISAPFIIPITNLETHKTKNHIDTRTLVSIQSGTSTHLLIIKLDSAGVRIFFTLDGSKPVEGQRRSGGRSRMYTDPILLPAGRVAVRAVAVTRDGRQSSVVTKIFSVDQAESDTTTEDKEDGLQTYQQHQSEESSCSAGSVQRTSEPRQNGCSPPSGPRFLNRRLGSKGPKITASAVWKGSGQRVQSANSHKRKQLGGKQVPRVQRDGNFLWCPQCSSVRPSDPFARFCPHCGAVIPPLPVHKPPPAETEQMLLCASCHSLVPFNTGTCVVCEESIDGHWAPQDHVVCASCGSWNPAQVSSCVTCESRLERVGQGRSSTPTGQTEDGKMLSCSSCKRLNRGDAKFCDRCGRKPVPAVSRVTCWQCGASGPWYGLYCMACGVFFEGQALTKPCNDIMQPVEGTTHSQVSALPPHDASWKATPPPNSAPRLKVSLPSVDKSTQTIGLYYPSATELQKKEQQRTLAVIQQLATRDRQPPLTAISPGRGFWRKQLDHICAHLRSYTQNNSSFRTLLAEPRLGQMISAAIQEDQDEVTLTLSFMVAPPKQQQVGPNEHVGGSGGAGLVGQAQTLSSVTEQSADRTNSRSAEASGWRQLNANPKPEPSVTDCQLHKELGPDRGQISIIQQLLDQGADVSSCGSDSRHALAVAVVNGHCDVLPVLVQRGADVDQQSGPMKNTALHEAAALGSEGLQSAKLLLRCKASVRRRNAAGQTAYDVAVTSGCSDMVSLLDAQTGPDLPGNPGRSQ